jgi:hypothetical protein
MISNRPLRATTITRCCLAGQIFLEAGHKSAYGKVTPIDGDGSSEKVAQMGISFPLPNDKRSSKNTCKNL